MPADDSGPEPLPPAPVEAPIPLAPAPPRSIVKRFLPWLASLAVNLTLLVVLALLTVTSLLEIRIPLEVSALFNTEVDEVPLDVAQIGAASPEEVASQSAALAQAYASTDFQPSEAS